jgi:hypothetical protein
VYGTITVLFYAIYWGLKLFYKYEI